MFLCVYIIITVYGINFHNNDFLDLWHVFTLYLISLFCTKLYLCRLPYLKEFQKKNFVLLTFFVKNKRGLILNYVNSTAIVWKPNFKKFCYFYNFKNKNQ